MNEPKKINKKPPVPATRQDSIALRDDSIRMLKQYKSKGYIETDKPFPTESLSAANKSMLTRKGTTRTIRKGLRSAEMYNPTDYRQDINEYQYRQRETANGVLNLDVEPALYDSRVQPIGVKNLMGQKGSYKNDGVSIPYYGDLQISPEPINTPAVSPIVAPNKSIVKDTLNKPMQAVPLKVQPPVKQIDSTFNYKRNPIEGSVVRDNTRVGTSFNDYDPALRKKVQVSSPQVRKFAYGGNISEGEPKKRLINLKPKRALTDVGIAQERDKKMADGLKDITAIQNKVKALSIETSPKGTFKEVPQATAIDNTRTAPLVDPSKHFKRGLTKEQTAKHKDNLDTEATLKRIDKLEAAKKARNTKWTADNWRDAMAAETDATGDALRVSNRPNVFDDYLNPAVYIGDMASALGSAPKRARDEDSNMPYVTSVGTPLAMGALAGAGTTNTKQFINNIVNPAAGFIPKKLEQKGLQSIDDIVNSFRSKQTSRAA
jgi:hypothetical protein